MLYPWRCSLSISAFTFMSVFAFKSVSSLTNVNHLHLGLFLTMNKG